MTSSENVEIVRVAFDRFNRGGAEAVLEVMDPEVEFEYRGGRLDVDQRARGHAGMREFFAQLQEVFPDFRGEIEEYVEVGDDVVVTVGSTGTGKLSGIELEIKTWQVFTVRGGKIVRYRLYATRADALQAVGLRD